MPRMTVCSTSGCPELVPVKQGRCDAHARPAWANPSQHTLQRPKDWSARRLRCLRRDRFRCRWPGCRARAGFVDHVVPVADGGSWEQDNLQSLCGEHNAEKTRQDRLERSR